MIRQLSRCLIMVFLTSFGVTAIATAQCTTDIYCGGHLQNLGGAYPFSEDFAYRTTVYQGACCSSWVTVIRGCSDYSYVNVTNDASSNLLMRASLQIDSATAPAGSEFKARFSVDGVIRGEYLRTLTGHYPQREDFNAIYVNLSPASGHKVSVDVWLIDGPGTSITVSKYSFLDVQGVAATYPAGTTANGNTATVDGTWRQITDTLTFTNSSPVNLFTQGYLQFNSGTPGQHIAFGFSLDGANSQHTIELGVPSAFPSGLNVFDHYVYEPGYTNVPTGTHTLTMWAVNRDGGTSQVQWRQVEFIALPATSTQPMLEAISTSPLTVLKGGDGSTVFNPLFTWAASTNPWTKLLQYEYPADGATTTSQNGAGEVFIEFQGTEDGLWQDVQVGVEALYNPTYDANGNPTGAQATTDFTIEELIIPPGRYQKFMFTDPFRWDLATHPNLIRVFARKTPNTPPGQFTVGERYMSFRAVSTLDSTSCVIGGNPISDFNADNSSDIFWRNASTAQASLWLMNGTTPTFAVSPTSMAAAWNPVAFGDFDHDGKADVLWQNGSTGETKIWLGWNGTDFATQVASSVMPPVWQALSAGDVNADGKSAIFWFNSSTGQTSIWFMNGTTYSSVAAPTMSGGWRRPVFGDFDGDGKSDVFWSNSVTGETLIWLGWNGSTFTTQAASLTIPTAWAPVGTGDIDGDGKSDIFWYNMSTGETSIWFMNGTAFSSAIRSTTVPTSWSPVWFGDFDGDGLTDVFWRNASTGETSFWLGWNGTGWGIQVRSITVPTAWVPAPSP